MMNFAEGYKLPSLPSGYLWSVQEHLGNYDDGVYSPGEALTVGIRVERKVLIWNTKARLLGVPTYIVLTSDGKEAVENTAKKVYELFKNYLSLPEDKRPIQMWE